MSRILSAAMALLAVACAASPSQPDVSRDGATVVVDGLTFRDANRSGTLEAYEDWRQAPEARAADLVGRMTLDEKAGAMMHGTAPTTTSRGVPGSGDTYDGGQAREIIIGRYVTSVITRMIAAPDRFAEQNNQLQRIAASARLGIPLIISSDPRHHFQHVEGASVADSGFSQWPETLGLAALHDVALTRRFGDVARAEYRAVGIHMALSPQADLATEPRWPRINGTFGEDPELVHDQVQAYVEGFQGGTAGLQRSGVATVVKHWAGYGAAVDGFDAHNYYGRYARLDGAFPLHLRAFEGALDVHVAGVMPTYSILDVAIQDEPVEPVGGGFSRSLLTGLLRGHYHYDGLILSDWGITRDCGPNCRTGTTPHTFADIGMSWGMEEATELQRFVRGVQAGLDQFGGTEQSERLVQAVHEGALTEARLDASVQRVMALKFALGLFEDPFVDSAAAARIVSAGDVQTEAQDVQARALVLLENKNGLLPLASGTRVYLRGVDADAARRAGLTPTPLPDAQVAIVRAAAPSEPLHPNFFFGGRQHEGRLDFRPEDADYQAILEASARAPTVATVYLDRPAILTGIRDRVAALVVNFGVSDDALLAALTGRTAPQGRLPFELPSSMAEVQAQSPGRPHDTAHPLYPIGAGLALPHRN